MLATMGSDFFPTIFEVVDVEQLNAIAAYGGFPTRYPHWRFGMEYERLAKGYAYGLQKIYELVINNDPCYAYLLSSNSITDHRMVIAHVYGHCDFFKNNYWFSQTNRKMIDEMANHGNRIRRYMDRFGVEDGRELHRCCLSIEDLIDIHSPFIKRRADQQNGYDFRDPTDEAGRAVDRRRFRAKELHGSVHQSARRTGSSSRTPKRKQDDVIGGFPPRAGARCHGVSAGACSAEALAAWMCCRSSATKPTTSPRKVKPRS